jgi:GT2 family glycosyltransferase
VNADTLIVTATLGTRDSLERTLDSVRSVGGSRVHHRLICPPSKCYELEKRCPGYEVLEEPDVGGVFGAVNAALSTNSEGFKYVGFINDDDHWLPDFQKLIAVLDHDESVSIAYGRVRFVDPNFQALFDSTSSPFYRLYGKLLAHKVMLLTQQATLIRRSTFMSLNGFDCQYQLTADSEFWLRAIEQGLGLKYVPHVCAAYMIQPGQLSSNTDRGTLEWQEIMKRHRLRKDWRSHVALGLYLATNFPTYLKRILAGKGKSVQSMLET